MCNRDGYDAFSSGGFGGDEGGFLRFRPFFALLRVVLELSASFRSPRWRRVLCHRGLLHNETVATCWHWQFASLIFVQNNDSNSSNSNNSSNSSNSNNSDNKQASIPSVPFLFVSPFTMDLSWQPVTGAAQRWRVRRQRAAWRHEQQSIAQALAAHTHHSAPQRQTMARAREWERAAPHAHAREHPTPQAAGTEYFSLDVEDVPAAGSRPDRFAGVRPQERVQRHTVEHVVETFVFVPVLDAPVPLMAEQLVDVLALVEKQDREEEARMDRMEDLILEGAPRPCRRQGGLAQVGFGGPRGSGRNEGRKSFQRLPPVGAPVILQLESLQSKFKKVMGPQIQFLVRVLDIPVVPVMGTHSAKLCRRPGDSTGAGVRPTSL